MNEFEDTHIAYFSMEIGIHEKIPTYSGGLGILAGDTLRSCADLDVPVVGITLLYKKGYFKQRIDDHGNQQEEEVNWSPSSYLPDGYQYSIRLRFQCDLRATNHLA